MTNKKETKTKEVTEEVTQVVEQPKPVEPKEVKPKNNPSIEDGWVMKDRMYYLMGGRSPLTYLIRGSNIYYFDEEKGYERELKYTKNQKTSFVDEMKGEQRLEHIIFQNGSLFVPKNKVVLQKLLSLYHPHRDKLFKEHKPVEVAKSQIDWLELEVDALTAARDLSLIHI